MTQKQRLIFRYLARLMMVIPDATILTLRDLLDENLGHNLYQAWKDRLHPSTQNFFDTEFFGDKQYKATRAQIRRRLHGVLENPTFERLFSAKKNRIDLFDALNAGKIVLVNTAQDFLQRGAVLALGSHLHRTHVTGGARTRTHSPERAPADLPRYRRGPGIFCGRRKNRSLRHPGQAVCVRGPSRPPTSRPAQARARRFDRGQHHHQARRRHQ